MSREPLPGGGIMTPILPFAIGAVVVALGIFFFPDPVGYRRFRVAEVKAEESHE